MSTRAIGTPAEQTGDGPWAEANARYLRGELERLRLLLRRRVLWLRRQWRSDSAGAIPGLVISESRAEALLEGDDRQAEARFYAENPDAAVVARSLEKLDHQLDEQRRALARAGTPIALDVLVQGFALSPLERSVIVLCLAPELDPAFERLYAYAQDDVTRKYATVGLALSLFGGEGEEWPAVRAALLKESSLRRYRLVTGESAPSGTVSAAQPLRLDERILGYLLGVNRLDERAADLLEPMPPALLSPDMREAVDAAYGQITQFGAPRPWPVVNLMGPPYAGKRAIARALCERLGLELHALDVSRLPVTPAEQRELFRLLEREAVLLRFALYVDLARGETADAGAQALVAAAVERLGLFVIVGSRQRWTTQRPAVVVTVPRPDAQVRRSLWRQALAALPPPTAEIDLDHLIHQFEFGPTEIQRAVAEAQSRWQLRDPAGAGSLSADDLVQACRMQVGWRIQEMAQRLLPAYTWEDIVLPADVVKQLHAIAAQVGHRAKVYEGWGFGAKLTRGQGITALFSGPSGTGKTMAAEILANHLGLDLYRIDLAGVINKYIGETEKNLRRVFDAAEQSGAVLFFDEADALFGKRSEVKDSHDRYANIEINYLLQRMEDYRGLAILATNMKSHLDEAFLRRLRFLVDFPFPDASHRLRIWKSVTPPQATLEGIDWEALARLEIPGGNIRNIVVNAAFLAAADGTSIQMPHILDAAQREYSKIEKLLSPAEFGRYYDRVKP